MRAVTGAMLWAALSCGALAAQDDATITARLDTAEVQVGDRVTLDVTVEHASDAVVQWPAPADTLGAFEVMQRELPPPVRSGGRTASTMRLVLTTFELGETEVPPMTVALTRGEDEWILESEPAPLTVASVGLDDTGDIRDIKPPLGIPRNWWVVSGWLALLAAVVAGSLWVLRRWRRGDRPGLGEPVPTVPARPAHELAYEALDRLEASTLLARGEVKLFHIEVSEIIRSYLDGRFGIEAMDMTTDEVLDALRRVGPARDAIDRFETFFGRADLVKFAKSRPDPATSGAMIDLARDLVDATRPPAPTPVENELVATGVDGPRPREETD